MRLRATTKIRNDYMITAREKQGLSQLDFAAINDIPPQTLMRLERLDYPKFIEPGILQRLSESLKLTQEQIVPSELWGKKIRTYFFKTAEIEANLLCDYTNREQRLISASPDMLLEDVEDRLAVVGYIDKANLSYREREIIKLRYGIGDGYTYTLEEVGRIFKVSRERICSIEAKALRKIRAYVEREHIVF